jgi:hypothetical protein
MCSSQYLLDPNGEVLIRTWTISALIKLGELRLRNAVQ